MTGTSTLTTGDFMLALAGMMFGIGVIAFALHVGGFRRSKILLRLEQRRPMLADLLLLSSHQRFREQTEALPRAVRKPVQLVNRVASILMILAMLMFITFILISLAVSL